MSKPITIRSKDLDGAEVSWFAPICNGDTDFLGEMADEYKSNWETKSYGVSRQAEMRSLADMEGFVEPNLWTPDTPLAAGKRK